MCLWVKAAYTTVSKQHLKWEMENTPEGYTVYGVIKKVLIMCTMEGGINNVLYNAVGNLGKEMFHSFNYISFYNSIRSSLSHTSTMESTINVKSPRYIKMKSAGEALEKVNKQPVEALTRRMTVVSSSNLSKCLGKVWSAKAVLCDA